NDPPSDGSEPPTTAEQLRFFEDVEEQGRVFAERLHEILRERLEIARVQDEVLRDAHGPRDILPRRQAERLAALEVPLRERVDRLRYRLREDAQSERELRVNLPTRLDIELALRELEEPRPLDHVSRRPLSEAAKVLFRRLREDRDVLHGLGELVLASDHRVSQPGGRHGQLQGHE